MAVRPAGGSIPDPSKPITMADVARHAGVAKTTVSYVLNGTGGVSADRRSRILSAIDELGYRPNRFARGLRSRSVSSIGFVGDISDESVARVAAGAAAAGGEDLMVLLVETDRATLDWAPAAEVDGFVYAATKDEFSDELVGALASRGPVVTVGEPVADSLASSVVSDYRNIARTLTERVVARGHRRLGMLTGSDGRLSTAEWAAGVRESALALGAQLVSDEEDGAEAGGCRAAERLLGAAAGRPTAVLCSDDDLAFRVIAYCRMQGLDVPGDVSVTGFGDVRAASLIEPALTSVRLAQEEIGAAAVELLRSKRSRGASVIVSATVVERESLGDPR